MILVDAWRLLRLRAGYVSARVIFMRILCVSAGQPVSQGLKGEVYGSLYRSRERVYLIGEGI